MDLSAKKIFAAFLGGAALLAGSYVTLDKLHSTLEGQLADRFAQAVDLLGRNDLELRLGGIYALERLAKVSEKYYPQIIDILVTYVRERATWKNTAPPLDAPTTRPAPDMQAALTVLGRRPKAYHDGETQRLDLRKTDLRRANLAGAHLEGAILSFAHLEEANLGGAYLDEAILREAHLERASLAGAHLGKVFLGGAYLAGAKLREADVGEAYLNGAHLEGADLLGVDLRAAFGLTWEQLKTARKDNRTRLPDYLRLPAPPPPAR